MRDKEVADKRVTVMGLGHHGGGVGAARWLAANGARVTITDQLPAERLQTSLALLAGVPIDRWRLGGHDEADFRSCDLLIVNPAVPPNSRWVQLAREHGARISSEIELFLARCRGRMIGVTGSVGKSSTAAMLHHILDASGARSWLGGNFGGSLLGDLSSIESEAWVVLELSSFQLHWLASGVRMPELAVITNFQANHLDWHPRLEHYRRAKQRLIAEQRPGARYVLGSELAGDAAWQGPWPGKRIVCWPEQGIGRLKAFGRHQRENAAIAAAAAASLGCDRDAIAAGLAAFGGLPHRLQPLGWQAGRLWIDDSKATTPASTLAAIGAVETSAWWLIGGADKGSDFEPLIDALVGSAKGVACYGATGVRLFQLAKQRGPDLRCTVCDTLERAVRWSSESSAAGDTIVLSPACSSLDQFRDYAHRGEVFRDLIRQIESSNERLPIA